LSGRTQEILKLCVDVNVMYQGHRQHAASQSHDSMEQRRHAHRMMAELQQLHNMQKQHVINIQQQNAVSLLIFMNMIINFVNITAHPRQSGGIQRLAITLLLLNFYLSVYLLTYLLT